MLASLFPLIYFEVLSVQEAGLAYTFKHISEELRASVRHQLLQGMEPAEIVRQNQDRFITSHMREKNIMDRAEAVQSLHDSKPHRDFYLSRQDVSNIRKEIDRRNWRFCEDQQRSLLLWAREHKEDVLVLKQQTPIEGTPDHAFVLRSQSTTAAAGGEGGFAEECGFYNDSAHSRQTAQSAEAAEDDNADACNDAGMISRQQRGPQWRLQI